MDDVVAPFGAGSNPPFVADHVCIGDHFGADTFLLQIEVDFAGGFSGGRPFADGPGAGFDFTGGDVGDEIERVKCLADQTIEYCNSYNHYNDN